jgi:hypothetical protein
MRADDGANRKTLEYFFTVAFAGACYLFAVCAIVMPQRFAGPLPSAAGRIAV